MRFLHATSNNYLILFTCLSLNHHQPINAASGRKPMPRSHSGFSLQRIAQMGTAGEPCREDKCRPSAGRTRPHPAHTVGEPRGEPVDKYLINKDNGGPGGRIKIVDFIEFFVGQNQKSSRIVPHAPATTLKSKRTALSAYVLQTRHGVRRRQD